MKKLLNLFVCLSFLISASATNPTNEKVPLAAKTSFAAKFPAAQKVKWSVEKPGEFEAEFIRNKVETSALFDTKGNLLETETEVRESELPQGVKIALSKDFAGYKLDEIEKATDSNGSVLYEMEVDKGKDKYEISFDVNGKLLKKEAINKKERKD